MITGPPGNQEAEVRFQIYRETLKECGVAYNERLIAEGDFIKNSGTEAMKQLLKVNTSIDVVFAANDGMALGAIKALKESNYQVPGDVAVSYTHLTLPTN